MNELATFEKIYDEHVSRVRSILCRMCPPHEVDDLAQECFIRVWKNKESFRGEANLSSWIYRIAMNVAYDSYRNKAARPKTEELNENSTDFQSKSTSVDKLADQ